MSTIESVVVANDTQTALLEAHNLSKSFHTRNKVLVCALDSISFSVPKGSFAVLTGPSGSGKTTLLSLVGALDRPTSGSVLFRGRNLGECSDVELARLRRRMGFIFQDCSLIPGLLIWENITYPLIPRGVGKRERWQIAREILDRLRLPEKLSMFPHELSGGEQRRVAIARALAGRPELVLADEPVSDLDPENSREVIDLFQEIHAGGTTMILSAHDPALLPMATMVLELSSGTLKTVSL